MVLKLSALCASRPLPPGRFLVLISVRGWADPRAIVWLEGLGQLKNPVTSLGIEPAIFQLVAYCLYQLCYYMPPSITQTCIKMPLTFFISYYTLHVLTIKGHHQIIYKYQANICRLQIQICYAPTIQIHRMLPSRTHSTVSTYLFFAFRDTHSTTSVSKILPEAPILI
jgi:hypothetical protein